MKVRELRKKLNAFDDELDVKVTNVDTLGDDYCDVESLFQAAENYSLAGYTPPFVVLSATVLK